MMAGLVFSAGWSLYPRVCRLIQTGHLVSRLLTVLLLCKKTSLSMRDGVPSDSCL